MILNEIICPYTTSKVQPSQDMRKSNMYQESYKYHSLPCSSMKISQGDNRKCRNIYASKGVFKCVFNNNQKNPETT